MKNPAPQPLRCAIYTRVSTEHGLEQEFNSLHNQREAAEAYVKSQAHEGWRLIPTAYDDGGFSGGSVERPGLQSLLGDIRARRIDVVVVYKVDRLTRSLADFAKLVELFDAHGVSFVSVTQAFNTTTSMGRLTLNVLLSFAQFEREVTGERIRDKIAASKRKGLWMGGVVPLGYRVADRALHLVPEHAEVVRMLYREYLRCETVGALKSELDARSVKVPDRVDGAGRKLGGTAFSRGHLYKLLSNPVYIGEIVHKGVRHVGQHPPLIDPETWEAVQAKLAANLHESRHRREGSDAPLIGRVFDDRSHAMSPSYAQKGQIRYRYYVSQALLQGRRAEAGSRPRVPAPELEALVLDRITTAAKDNAAGEVLGGGDDLEQRPPSLDGVERVIIGADSIEIILSAVGEGGGPPQRITAEWRPSTGRRRRSVLSPDETSRPIRAEARAKALAAIAAGRCWLEELASGAVKDTAEIAGREGCSERSVRMTLSLAFLSPNIVRAIVDGTAPRGIGVSRLSELPSSWKEQASTLEFLEP